MAKPWTHAESSSRRFGGKPEDYIRIHEEIDSSKKYMPDNRGRALTHNSWFVYDILPKIFGTTLTNSDGKVVSVSLVGEYHLLEDFGGKFIPSPQDYLQEIEMQPWMQNGMGSPPSCAKLFDRKESLKYKVVD